MTSTLTLPDDPRIDALFVTWPEFEHVYAWPRTAWLHQLERILRDHYPAATGRALSLLARSVAPFQLAKPGVP